jgi:hypothetical protein
MNTEPNKLMGRREAKMNGFFPLTIAYTIPREQTMMNRVLSDMRRSKIDCCIVITDEGQEVWRRKSSN